MACRICKASVKADPSGRCRCCRIAKAATDMGTSYGKLKAEIYEREGEQIDDDPNIRQCKHCKKLFLKRNWNQIYCSMECAQAVAKKNYNKRQRAKAARAPAKGGRRTSCRKAKSSKSKQPDR